MAQDDGKKKRPKIDKYLTKIDILNTDDESDYSDEQHLPPPADTSHIKGRKFTHPAKSNQNSELQIKSPSDKLLVPPKWRRWFTAAENKTLFLQAQIPELSHEVVEKAAEYVPKPYVYIQMRLDVVKITPQYEENLAKYQMAGVSMRKAEDTDVPVLTKIYNRAFMMGTDPYSPITEENMRQIMALPRGVVLVAEGLGEIFGFIILDLEGENNEYAVIVGLGTDPRWRRKGMAKFLGYGGWNYLRNLNVKELRCEVFEKNIPSLRLIQSLEFEEYDRKIYYF
jgi:ribosomal protein S18 acetylase RimI-like enzyme